LTGFTSQAYGTQIFTEYISVQICTKNHSYSSGFLFYEDATLLFFILAQLTCTDKKLLPSFLSSKRNKKCQGKELACVATKKALIGKR